MYDVPMYTTHWFDIILNNLIQVLTIFNEFIIV